MKTDGQQGIVLNVVVGIVGAMLGGWLISPMGHVEQGQLKACADALEEVEARSAHLGAARHVEGVQALGQLEVVLGLEALRRKIPCSTNGFQDGVVVLASAGDTLDDE